MNTQPKMKGRGKNENTSSRADFERILDERLFGQRKPNLSKQCAQRRVLVSLQRGESAALQGSSKNLISEGKKNRDGAERRKKRKPRWGFESAEKL